VEPQARSPLLCAVAAVSTPVCSLFAPTSTPGTLAAVRSGAGARGYRTCRRSASASRTNWFAAPGPYGVISIS
jgi:hypothetical protein